MDPRAPLRYAAGRGAAESREGFLIVARLDPGAELALGAEPVVRVAAAVAGGVDFVGALGNLVLRDRERGRRLLRRRQPRNGGVADFRDRLHDALGGLDDFLRGGALLVVLCHGYDSERFPCSTRVRRRSKPLPRPTSI